MQSRQIELRFSEIEAGSMTPELEAALELILAQKPRDSSLQAVTVSDLQQAREIVSWCHENGARILYPGHTDYPFSGRCLEEQPKFLTCWGPSCWQTLPSMAVVGSREPTRAAIEWMEIHLTEFLRRSQALIISGGARGIDQKAHFLALRAGRPTLVFLPSGLAAPYPRFWSDWKDEVIAHGGAVISTYAPHQEVRKSHFEDRNRLIASLARMVFVVEARKKSGSSMTARLAKEMACTICCLPGSPMDPRCAGTVDLLFDGAFPVRDADDLAILFSLRNHEQPVSSRRV